MIKFIFAAALLVSSHAFAQSLADVLDLPNAKWRNAKTIPERMVKHTGKEPLRLTVHYTGVHTNPKQDLKAKLRGLFEFSTLTIEGSKKKLWGDMPYHFYIDMKGLAGEGRDTAYQPDTNTKYPTDGHITIVVEGDDKDVLSPEQAKKLQALLEVLQKKFSIPSSRIATHMDFANTDCPGPSIKKWVGEYVKSHTTASAPEQH